MSDKILLFFMSATLAQLHPLKSIKKQLEFLYRYSAIQF